jgi:DNA repair protein RecO (recombination protein O)
MYEEKTEGIVLRSQDYQERNRIVTLFTPQGMLSLVIRGISKKNSRLLSLSTPFCYGEYVYHRGSSELLSFRDGTVLDDHFDLRQSWKSLQTAGALAGAILTSQMVGKPAPALFALYKSYQDQASHFENSEVLLASFYLKLLKHEGLLSISPHCLVCKSPSPLFLHEGESLCSKHHGIQEDFSFTCAEWAMLLNLEGSLRFSSLRNLNFPLPFFQKIKTLFHASISC